MARGPRSTLTVLGVIATAAVAGCGAHPSHHGSTPASSAATSTTTAVACAGQCGPPFQMSVGFRAGTSLAQARHTLAACKHNPVVVRVGRPEVEPNGRYGASVFTTTLGGSVTSRRLLRCLNDQPDVVGVGWAD